MAHTGVLVDALKRELRLRGITYAALAPRLGLSEASVKRMFSRRDFTLRRLDDICRCAQIEFSELARAVARDEALITHLSLEQDNNPSEEAREHAQKNWQMMLKGLKEFVEQQMRDSPIELAAIATRESRNEQGVSTNGPVR